MNFWRTLFDRQTKPYKPAYPVTGITQPTPVGTTVSQAPLPYQTLTLSSTAYARGTPTSGTVNNATGGSIIVPVGLPTGLTINSSLRTFTWDGSGNASTGSFTMYENIPGASTNPKASVIAYTITGASGVQFTFNLTANSGLIILLEDI